MAASGEVTLDILAARRGRWSGLQIVLLAAAAACLPATSYAQIGTAPVTQDTWLDQTIPVATHGGDTYLRVAHATTFNSQDRRALLQFDLAGLPSTVTITGATLHIYQQNAQNFTINVYRLTESWTEGGANWNSRNGSNAWSSAGGTFNPTIHGSFSANATGWRAVALDPALVQNWLGGSWANYGVILDSPNNNLLAPTVDFDSKEGANPAYLTVQYVYPRISSVADQTFWVGKAQTPISPITVSDSGSVTSITAANDIRIRIPAGFDMSWDTLDVTASISGGAVAKVSSTVSYEDGGKTLVIDVTSDFAPGDVVTVSDLSFRDFTATSSADNLELEVYNDGSVSALDDRTIEIASAGTPTISSEFDQSFRVGSPPIAISTLTVTDDTGKPVITAANDIRVRIPAGFNMTWDTSDNTATILGTALGKVSTTVSYEDGGQTLVIDVTADFAAGDLVTIADLSFTSFTAESPEDHLELEVLNDGTVAAEDDKIIFVIFIVSTPGLSSAEDQMFTVGDPPTAMTILRITDDPVPVITASGDIRIRIPAGMSMIWDTLNVTPVLSGRARSNVSSTVTYENNGKTMVIDVLSNFGSDDWLNVKGVNFLNFASATSGRRLELDINNDGISETVDLQTKQILGPSYGVYVTPDTTAQSQLPSNGANYTVDFNVANIGSITDDYDLLTTNVPGSAISVISITGPGVTQGANADSARLSGLVSAGVAVVTVTYSVADLALGTTDTLVFTARSVGNPVESDNGRLELTVVRPNVTTSKAVDPTGPTPPGSDLTYSISFTNVGSANAVDLVTVDSLASEVEFQVGSVVNNLPAGSTVVVEYSDDGGTSWSYTPVSAGCGATAGYDDCVTHVRWTLQNDLSYVAPDNTGDYQFVARVK